MELFCALLTGFFWWLFLYHWHHSELVRAREAAGALLIEVRVAASVIREARRQHRFHIGKLMLFAAEVWFILQASEMFFLRVFDRTPAIDVLVAVITCISLETAFPLFRKDALLELREHGVILREKIYEDCPLELTLTPWAEITGCNWYKKAPAYHVHTKHLALESDGLLPGEVAAVTAVVGRFVPVYDSRGRLLAEPESAETNTAARNPSIGGWKFQFTLQSLLLLMVLVSCAASCFGMHYRRLQSQRDAVAKPAPVVAPPVTGR
ncbi:MAG: hypothetical protein WCB27_05015 [Thermoguttaceae bacterium]|jgi:hypothetical protein